MINTAIEMVKHKKCDAEGDSKECYYVNLNDNEYVLLKHKRAISTINILVETMGMNSRKNNINNFVKNNINIPTFLDFVIKENYVYELHKRAKGRALFYRTVEAAGSYEEFINRLLNSSEILSNCKLEKFENFFSDALYINSYGIILDEHPENYLIQSDGTITFLDVNANAIYSSSSLERRKEILEKNYIFTDNLSEKEINNKHINFGYMNAISTMPSIFYYVKKGMKSMKGIYEVDPKTIMKLRKNMIIIGNRWTSVVDEKVKKEKVSKSVINNVLSFNEKNVRTINNYIEKEYKKVI